MLDILAGPSAPVDAITVDSNTLELGILLFVDNDDLDAFAQNISQLKPRYATLASLGAANSRGRSASATYWAWTSCTCCWKTACWSSTPR